MQLLLKTFTSYEDGENRDDGGNYFGVVAITDEVM
jgi:hypothetical protein